MRFYSDLFHGIGDSIRFLGIDYTPNNNNNNNLYSGLSKPKMPVAKFELLVAKYFYRLPPGGVLMVQI